MYNRLHFLIVVLLILFTINVLSDKDRGDMYFPSSSESFWVYEDQDGNELTRRVTESKIDDSRTYAGFKFEPELKDSKDFIRFLHPAFCHFGEDWVYLLVGEELRKAIKARLTDEMELFAKLSVDSLKKSLPPNNSITVDLAYDVKVDAEDLLKLLPMQVGIDKGWKALKINATIAMKFNIEGLGIFPDAEDLPTATLEFAIIERGKVVGTESIETPAGTFDECLKIVYKTDTKMTETRPIASADLPGESVTTIWYAPHVGIIKIRNEAERIFLHALSDRELVKKHASTEEAAGITKPLIRTFELKKYSTITERPKIDKPD